VNKIKIERKWAMPNKWTFQIKPISRFLDEEMTDGLWIDPFAGTSKLAKITNDINPEMNTDFHLDATDFLKTFETESVDGVLFDPPYSSEQIKRSYDNAGIETMGLGNITQSSFYSRPKIEISRIVKPNGKVLSFGWNSNGIGKSRGFRIDRILLVPHGGNHLDTICVSEIKLQCRLSSFSISKRSGESG